MPPKSRIEQQEKTYRENYAHQTRFLEDHVFVHEGDLRTEVPKRLIICCDGTWFAADKGIDNLPSNAAKIGRFVAAEGLGITKVKGQTSKIVKVPQIVYYQSGVGAGNSTWVNKRVQGAFGISLDENVCTAYNFLCNNYAPGDELFFFGFSRGAYTARALSGLVASAGILPPGSMHYFYEMYEAYKKRGKKDFRATEWWKATNRTKIGIQLKHVNIRFVGVWDTVGSLGIPDSYLARWTGANEGYQFHNTELHKRIHKAAHALAIDEYRGAFSPTMWFEKKAKKYGWNANLIQCWFPGYHRHIGGGTKAGVEDETSIDEITLAWMVDQVGDLLTWDEVELDAWVEENMPGTGDIYGEKKTQDAGGKPVWGEGNLKDSASYAYKVPGTGGWVSRTPGQYNHSAEEEEGANDYIDNESDCEHEDSSGKDLPSFIGQPSSTQILPRGIIKSKQKFYPTHEYIHPVVRYRMGLLEKKPQNLGYTPGWLGGKNPITSYEPEALKKFQKPKKENANDHFVYWKKEDHEKGDVIIREYQIPPQDARTFHPVGLERRIIPPEVIAELDKDNNYN
ncbi:hypothetical protein ABW20_dc0109748 [Dactylellina cionopaga]|nr:hypothetical protein ABW20_dc0109748 [Dactylellina cionopaga]